MGNELDGLALIDADQFKDKLSLRSDSRFYELARTDPDFPKPIRKGRRFTRWVRREADRYVLRLMERRDETEQQAA